MEQRKLSVGIFKDYQYRLKTLILLVWLIMRVCQLVEPNTVLEDVLESSSRQVVAKFQASENVL